MAQLRAIPNKGVGYGVIRYLHADQAIKDEFAMHENPLLSFNYLGQFDASLGTTTAGSWSIAKESSGINRAPNSLRSNALGLVGRVVNGRLSMAWQYNTNLHQESFIKALADKYQAALNDLIKHCLSVKSSVTQTLDELTPNHVNDQLQLIRPANNDIKHLSASPLFCLHHRGGHTREYKALVKQFDSAIPVYGIQSRILVDPYCNDYQMSNVAEQYADLIQSVQANGPYRLLGWSLGGVLAVAVTEVLEARGQCVSFLGLLDAALASEQEDSSNTLMSSDNSLLERLLYVFGATANERYQALDDDTKLAFEQRLNKLVEFTDEHQAVVFACDWISKIGLIDSDVIDADYLRLRYQTTVQSRKLIRSYVPNKVNARAHVWWAEDSLIKHQAPTQWQDVCADIRQHKPCEGGHYDIVQSISLADQLAAYINVED